MVVKDEIKSKLEYLGLDLDNIFESLSRIVPLEFTVSRLKEDKDLKVYKYIPIEDIEILLTPHNKGEDLKTRYSDAMPLIKYLDSNAESPEDYARYLEFINMFKFFKEDLIESIEEEQNRYINKIPFDIRYSRSHMWNIYYDEKTKKYFMLVCTKEGDFTELFYLIKKKIEIDKQRNKENKNDELNEINKNFEEVNHKDEDYSSDNDFTSSDDNNNDIIVNEEKEFEEYFDEEDRSLAEDEQEEKINEENSENKGEIAEINKYIYAPINYISLSEKYIVPNELLEIENYLWYFTKKWPITYEYYDMKNNYSLIIKGETKVFDRIESDYKFVIKNKEDAIKLYKHIKALFMLETSTDNYFGFKPEIKRNFELSLTYDGIEIGFDDIPDLIFKKYNEIYQEIEVLNNENKSKTVKINMLKDDLTKKQQLYKEKQSEIVQYLECKESFTKKVRYFFKRSKRVTKTEMNRTQIKEEIKKKLEADRKEVEVDYTVIDTVRALEKKEFYTIDDFIFIHSLYEKLDRKVSELILDIRGIKLALLNVNNKLSNAETYLEEIDFHKKSIFEFWKFANKDKKLSLEEAGLEEDDIDKSEIEIPRDRVFNFDMDVGATAEYMDEIQRKKLSKEELNAIYLLDNNFINYINMLKLKDIDEYAMMTFLEDLKKEYKEESKYIGEVFDVFGTNQPTVETRYLKTNEFREADRNKFKILNLNQSLDKFKFLEKLTENLKYIDEAMLKMKTNIELPLYKAMPSIERLGANRIEIFNIDVEEELINYKGVGNNINLIKINLPKNSPAIFCTNIIYYENQNNTLPLGMDKGKKVILDLSKFKLEEKIREKIVVNKYFSNYTSEKVFKNVNIIEYNIVTK